VDAARLRAVLSALLAAGVPLGELLPRAVAAVEPGPDSGPGTRPDTGSDTGADTGAHLDAVAVVVDVAAGTLTWVCAGRAGLALRAPDGQVRLLEDGQGRSTRPRTVPFPVGSVVLARPGDPEQLGTALQSATGNARAVAADVLGRPAAGRSQDDVALLALARTH
jgi:hypothetical protein